jgi:hypothetical protein
MKNRKSVLVLAMLLSIMGMISACYSDKEDQLYPTATVDPNCVTTNLTYTANLKAFLDSKCATSGCHTAGQQSPNLSTFASASAAASSLYNAASNGGHSSRFSWTTCEKSQLQAWCASPLQ